MPNTRTEHTPGIAAAFEESAKIAESYHIARERDERDNARNATATLIAASIRAVAPATPRNPDRLVEAGFRPMSEWDRRDRTVLLLVDYSDGCHALDDAQFAITIGHNNDHNVGDGEGKGWEFAGWCWSHDHYVQGEGKPVGWMPLPHHLADTFAAPAECASAPNGRHQVDTSMESGPNNCFHCEAPMPVLSAAPAKAIEARRAETGTGSVHESAVPQAFAQTIPGDSA